MGRKEALFQREAHLAGESRQTSVGGWGSAKRQRSLPRRGSALPTGSAGVSFPEKSGKPKKPAAPIYGGWFRVLSGGSYRGQAQPAGSKWQSALPTGLCIAESDYAKSALK